MLTFQRGLLMYTPAALLGFVSVAPLASADCPCSRGGGGMSHFGSSHDLPPPMSVQMLPQGGMPMQEFAPAMPLTVGPPVAGGSGAGYTYYRALRTVPAQKPPRVGMLEIRTANAVEVHVLNTHPFREKDELQGYQDKNDANLWRFESEPLFPGNPHIVEVVILDAAGQRTTHHVRLVPNRIIELSL